MKQLQRWALALVLAGAASGASAKVSAEKAAELDGPKYTCIGAERAGSKSGVAEYTGKWFKTWPGVTQPHGYEPGPYAAEKPLFTINAGNQAQYAARLTPGQKALLAKYPQSFRINVYPSHRDFRFADWVCDTTKTNAATAELLDEGMGTSGIGGAVPFPFPASGLEAVWNTINPHRAWTESVVTDIADVYANGTIGWGRNKFMSLNLMNDPVKRLPFTHPINAYFYTGYLLPEREKGSVAVGYSPNNFAKGRLMAWQYLPGIRRVRQAPEVCCDYPVPPAGLRTVDDDYGFNGSPERFTWKLVGKQELYVPYHNFRINDPALKYKQLMTPGSINPDYERYELHRVWVVEGTLKPGLRHLYSKRILFVDEDSWLTIMADNYDVRGELWRMTMVNYFYSQESGTFHRSATLHHDLLAGSYEANYLTNESKNWWRLNLPLKPAEFTPEAAARGGR